MNMKPLAYLAAAAALTLSMGRPVQAQTGQTMRTPTTTSQKQAPSLLQYYTQAEADVLRTARDTRMGPEAVLSQMQTAILALSQLQAESRNIPPAFFIKAADKLGPVLNKAMTESMKVSRAQERTQDLYGNLPETLLFIGMKAELKADMAAATGAPLTRANIYGGVAGRRPTPPAGFTLP